MYCKELMRLILSLADKQENGRCKSFYICQRAGKLVGFFDHLTRGLCFENRVRDTTTWAAQLSEVKPFTQCMQEWIADYKAYTTIMGQPSKDGHPIDVEYTDKALVFIMQRYRNFPCMPDKNYAPDGEITDAGVKYYLSHVLEYDEPQSQCMVM